MTRERTIAAVLAGLALLALGYGAGWASRPAKVIDRSEEVTALQQQVQSLTQENTTLKRHTVKRTERTFNAGKPATELITEDTHVDRVTDARGAVGISTDVHSARLVEKTTERAPANRLGLLADYGTDGRFSLGPQYQHRLFGPFVLSLHVQVKPPDLAKPIEVRGGAGLHIDW